MKNLKLLDTAAAKAAGFRPLTIGYQLPQERPMLDNVLADMRRGNIKHCLVQSNDGVSVWRAGGACTQGGCAGGSATGQHLTPTLCPSRTGRHARRGSKKSTQPAAKKAAQHWKGKRS